MFVTLVLFAFLAFVAVAIFMKLRPQDSSVLKTLASNRLRIEFAQPPPAKNTGEEHYRKLTVRTQQKIQNHYLRSDILLTSCDVHHKTALPSRRHCGVFDFPNTTEHVLLYPVTLLICLPLLNRKFSMTRVTPHPWKWLCKNSTKSLLSEEKSSTSLSKPPTHLSSWPNLLVSTVFNYPIA